MQRDYTIAAHKYLLSLGPMEKGDWLCVNLNKHTKCEKFNTEELKMEHWQICHDIALTDVFDPFVLPDAIKELSPRLRLPSTVKGDRGRARQVRLWPDL